MSDFQDLINQVVTMSKRFPNEWNAFEYYTDLVEEVGELGNAVLVDMGKKSEKRRRADMKDSFADILFVLIAFAHHQHVDLEVELKKMLEAVEKRIDNQEYE